MLLKSGISVGLLIAAFTTTNVYATPMGGTAAYFLSEICMKYENPNYQGNAVEAVKDSPFYQAWPLKANLDIAEKSFNNLSESEKSGCSKYQDEKFYSLTYKVK